VAAAAGSSVSDRRQSDVTRPVAISAVNQTGGRPCEHLPVSRGRAVAAAAAAAAACVTYKFIRYSYVSGRAAGCRVHDVPGKKCLPHSRSRRSRRRRQKYA